MRRNVLIMLLLTILATGVAGSVYAQTNESDNYLSNKEQRQKDRQERRRLKREYKERLHRSGEPEVKIPPVVKKKTITYPQTTRKSRYRIDVLMQMYLDDLVKEGNVTYKDRIPDKAQAGMAFYQGINMAADSLKKAGFKIDIYIHDITSAMETPAMLVSRGKLDSSDLIIGAVPSADVSVLADFAGSHKINFISVLSATDGGVKNDPYFTMLLPSLKAYCEWIAGAVADKYAAQKVLLLYRKTAEADSVAWKYLVSADSINKTTVKKLSCKMLPSREKLLTVIDTGKTNVMLLPVLDNNYADSILNLLSVDFPSTHFEVYGMPTWAFVTAAKKKSLPDLDIHIAVPFNFDGTSASAKYIARTYKKDYGGRPSEFVYRGYETMFWYANLLKQYGTIFNEHYDDNATAPFTKFEVKTRWDKDGNLLYNENMHVALSTAAK